MIRNVLAEIRQDLIDRVDQEYKIGANNYFKEKVNILGVRTPEVRKIARMYFAIVADFNKQEMFEICKKLFDKEYFEETTVAIDWLYRIRAQYKERDLKIFEKWLSKYISNWGHCDDFCGHCLGAYFEKYPGHIHKLDEWAKSPNRWFRRASAVCMIYLIRRSKNFMMVFEIGDILMDDEDDLVRKGMGWLLREAWIRYPSDVYRYLQKNKDRLARVTLRYAVEKMDKLEKQGLMIK